ncbi:hypothetical protein HO133_010356 [Letharia lupina]|uniref:2-methylcitrate dehydratase n=1 Tax=Letharia lupina TaxID=560253 RepID=A0A8H6CKZ2_9LECA|nr:uncharacterized protein HO133_010356 [Letharia lupina]KAF6225159.1 hypothetical protein HO133_010356 [Letharia lupina]
MATRTPNDNTRQAYDQIIIDITTYVYHHKPSSPKAWLHARTALLDALGCAIETLTTSPECVRMLGPVVPGTVVPNGFRLPGTSYQLDPVKGAFDMGTLIRYLDHSDGFYGAEWGHPSDNLGAILAVSDWLNRTSPKVRGSNPMAPPLTVSTLLTALIKAYEIQGIFQILNSFNALGLDHVILVKVSATAVTCWLLGLSEPQTHAALSQVWMDGHPLRTYRHAPNTGPRKGWAGGDACMRAVHLSLLTKAGQPGAPTVLTAPRWGFYAATFKNRVFSFHRPFGTWVMENIFFKLIPAEGHAISALEAVLQISRTIADLGLDVDEDISKIRVRTHAGAILIISKSGELYNAADRDHCMQYMMAVTFLKGSLVEYSDYSDTSLWANDPRVDRLRAKIELVEEERFSREYLDVDKRSAANGVKVMLRDGRELDEIVIEYPLGHALRPETIGAVETKIRKNLERAFSPREVEKIFQSSETEDMPIKDFVDLFAKDKEAHAKL